MEDFISWLKTWVLFHLFGRYQNWSLEQTEYFERNFTPKHQRDKNLKHEIVMFNRSKICQS